MVTNGCVRRGLARHGERVEITYFKEDAMEDTYTISIESISRMEDGVYHVVEHNGDEFLLFVSGNDIESVRIEDIEEAETE